MDKQVSSIIKLLVTQSMLCKSQACNKNMKNSNANIIKKFQKTSFWCQLAYNTQATGYMLTEKKVLVPEPGRGGKPPTPRIPSPPAPQLRHRSRLRTPRFLRQLVRPWLRLRTQPARSGRDAHFWA